MKDTPKKLIIRSCIVMSLIALITSVFLMASNELNEDRSTYEPLGTNIDPYFSFNTRNRGAAWLKDAEKFAARYVTPGGIDQCQFVGAGAISMQPQEATVIVIRSCGDDATSDTKHRVELIWGRASGK